MHVAHDAIARVVEVAHAAQRRPGADVVPRALRGQYHEVPAAFQQSAIDRYRCDQFGEAREVARGELG